MCPGKESTWKIQPFHITASGPESEGECESVKSGDGAGGLSEISALLVEARKVAAQVSHLVIITVTSK